MKVYLGIPFYGGAGAKFVSSLLKTHVALHLAGIEVEVDFVEDCCVISKARNEIVTRFMASGFDRLLFLDTDMVWNLVDIFTLLKSEHELCGLDYCKRTDELLSVTTFTGRERDGWLEATAIGTGLMCISRSVIEKMIQAYPETRYANDTGGISFALFDVVIIDGKQWGSDYIFCKRWVETGGDIAVLKGAKTGHIGDKIYENTETTQPNENHIVAKLKAMKVNPPTEADLISLIEAWGNQDWGVDIGGLVMLDMLAREGEGSILECGSGLSTLIMATSGREVITLEHNTEWVDKVRAYATAANLDITVIHAELKDGWYDIKEHTAPVSMLFVDGPPRVLSDRSLIADKITSVQDGCVFVVDDISTEKEVKDALSDKFRVEFLDMGRHAIGVYNEIH